MKLLITLIIVGILAYLGATVPLGKKNKTFFQHVQAIWKSDDVTDLKEGIEEKAGPAAEKLKEKVHDMTAPATPDAAPAGSGSN